VTWKIATALAAGVVLAASSADARRHKHSSRHKAPVVSTKAPHKAALQDTLWEPLDRFRYPFKKPIPTEDLLEGTTDLETKGQVEDLPEVYPDPPGPTPEALQDRQPPGTELSSGSLVTQNDWPGRATPLTLFLIASGFLLALATVFHVARALRKGPIAGPRPW
jgi:hypothetical protein